MGHQKWVRLLGNTMLLVASATLLLAVTGCDAVIRPSGDIETETREVDSFDKVALTGIGILTVKPGDTASLVIRADKSLMRYIQTDVSGGELEISVDTLGKVLEMGGADEPVFQLTVPTITAIRNTGSGTITGGPFSGGALTLENTGSGSMELDDVNVLNLDTSISGSGTVKMDGGVTGAQVVEVSGSGSYSAPDLESKVATARVSGSGSVELWVTEGLDATVTGSGGVEYWGSPTVTEETSGSGEVEALGPKTR